MLAQTRFLAEAFREYEQRVAASRRLRRTQLARAAHQRSRPRSPPARRRHGRRLDRRSAGLFLADFDLLTRLPGLAARRRRDRRPARRRAFTSAFTVGCRASKRSRPTVPRPSAGAADSAAGSVVRPATNPMASCSSHRDREEELMAVARRMAAAADRRSACGSRSAIVFKRPLPYLYLARDVFGAVGIAYQAFDALPLAAEPSAAALDLVLDSVESGFARRVARRAAALAASSRSTQELASPPGGRRARSCPERQPLSGRPRPARRRLAGVGTATSRRAARHSGLAVSTAGCLQPLRPGAGARSI